MSGIGDIGEALLAQFAAQADFTANPAYKDTHGWDFLVQIPWRKSDPPVASLDFIPPELTCMVQVKTTRNASSFDITLQNWARMMTQQLPFFVLVVTIDDDHEALAAHLVHVGREWCGKVLERLRREGADNVKALGDKTMAVTWGTTNALGSLDGRVLEAALRKAIGPDQAEYTKRKELWRRTLGYDNDAYRMTLKFDIESEEDFFDRMALWAVGLIPEIEAREVSAEEVRFGIPRPLDDLSGKSPVALCLTDLKPQRRFGVSLSDSTRTKHVRFEADAYFSWAVNPGIPPQYQRIRLAAGSVEVILTPTALPDGRPSFASSWTFKSADENGNTTLDAIGTCHGVLSILETVGRGGVLLGIDELGEWELAGLERSLPRTQRAFYRNVGRLLQVARRFELPGSTVVNWDNLDSQLKDLDFITAAVMGLSVMASLPFEDCAPGAVEGLLAKANETTMVRCASVTFEAVVIAALVVLRGPLHAEMVSGTNTVAVSIGDAVPVIEKTWVMSPGSFKAFDSGSEVAALETRLKADHPDVPVLLFLDEPNPI